MPEAELHGQHRVRLGSSFTTTDPEDSDAYVAFRYNFQPSTIDASRPSSLQGGSIDGSGDYILTTPSKESKEARHVFKGTQTAQKDIDCLLIYDESSDSYRLEKLGSVIRFDHQRQTTVAPGHARLDLDESNVKDETNDTAKAVETKQARQKQPILVEDEIVPQAQKPKMEATKSRAAAEKTQKSARQTEATPVEKSKIVQPAEPTRAATRKESDDNERTHADEEDDEEDDGELDDLANMLESTLEETNPQSSSVSGGSRLESAKSASTFPAADESSEDED